MSMYNDDVTIPLSTDMLKDKALMERVAMLILNKNEVAINLFDGNALSSGIFFDDSTYDLKTVATFYHNHNQGAVPIMAYESAEGKARNYNRLVQHLRIEEYGGINKTDYPALVAIEGMTPIEKERRILWDSIEFNKRNKVQHFIDRAVLGMDEAGNLTCGTHLDLTTKDAILNFGDGVFGASSFYELDTIIRLGLDPADAGNMIRSRQSLMPLPNGKYLVLCDSVIFSLLGRDEESKRDFRSALERGESNPLFSFRTIPLGDFVFLDMGHVRTDLKFPNQTAKIRPFADSIVFANGMRMYNNLTGHVEGHPQFKSDGAGGMAEAKELISRMVIVGQNAFVRGMFAGTKYVTESRDFKRYDEIMYQDAWAFDRARPEAVTRAGEHKGVSDLTDNIDLGVITVDISPSILREIRREALASTNVFMNTESNLHVPTQSAPAPQMTQSAPAPQNAPQPTVLKSTTGRKAKPKVAPKPVEDTSDDGEG